MVCILEKIEKYLRELPEHHKRLRDRATLKNRVKKEIGAYTRKSDFEDQSPFYFEQIKEVSELSDHLSCENLKKAEQFYHEETAKGRNVFYARGFILNNQSRHYKETEYAVSSDSMFRSITRKKKLEKPLFLKKY